MPVNQALADFLRSRRARLVPDGTLASHRRRRTPGLRREEVARRAGISTEWYVKLEQGRAVSPSDETIVALANALELDAVELAHLRSLSGKAKRPPFECETVPGPLRRHVESLRQPAYVTGQRWDILAWNAAAGELFGDLAQVPVADRNIMIFMLTDANSRQLFGGTWEVEARRMVSLFRVDHDLWPGDPAFADLVKRLESDCAEFSRWWSSHDISAPVSGTKHLRHPVKGPVQYEYTTFQANDDPRLKLAVYQECSASDRIGK